MAVLFEEINENDKYKNGIRLEERDGNYSLLVIQAGKNEKTYPRWVYPQKIVDNERMPGDKVIPQGVQLGNLFNARALLEQIMDALDVEARKQGQTGKRQSDPRDNYTPPVSNLNKPDNTDDIPF